MAGDLPYERLLQESLKHELKVVNAHLPTEQKPLSDLLREEYPHVVCKDGTTHLFSRKELRYLVGLMAVLCPGETAAKVIAGVLDMTVTPRQSKITIYKPQLAVIRRVLRTTTQYIFHLKSSNKIFLP